MKARTHRPVALLALITLAACGGTTANPEGAAPEPAAQETDFEALYLARRDSAMMHFTEADVRFMTGMIGHHGQALVMSAMAPRNGAGPAIRTLTSRITNAQRDEIATMQRWLRDRGQPAPEVSITGSTMMVHGPEYTMHMPGMLTQPQLDTLEAAMGPEFDRRFLQYMIQHHQGAVTMVHELFATDGAGLDEQLFKIANDIQADQTTEIARMKLMLENMTRPGGSH